MNYHHTDDVQAQRLKQILFPRKTRSSRTSINTSTSVLKQNQQTNHGYNIKQQITRLKQGIQLFLNKQPLTDNFLTTPRECLQIIKCMSDKMISYRDQIEEAINTLIESVPKPLTGAVHSSKYYMIYLKFGYLCAVVGIKRRRILGECIQNFKEQAYAQRIAIRQQCQQARAQEQKVQRIITQKISKAFNRWRLNACHMRKAEIQAYFYEKNIVESTKMLKLLSDESRMMLWLQKQVQCNADAVEILLYNARTNTIRSYQLETQALTSMFESVHNQSRISHGDQSIQLLNNNKIKRLEINLSHSLTKICIIKRQALTVPDMRRDPDYNRIDDPTCMHGLSARDVAGACIFTPIVSPTRKSCVGIVRQYFYNRVGQAPHADTVSMAAQMLQHSIKTSHIFQDVKQRSHTTRNRSYLKAVLILNQLEKDQQLGIEQEQEFHKQLCSYYPIKYVAQFGYQAINSVDKCPRYSVSAISNQESIISTNDIVCALSTMAQCQTQWVLSSNYIHIKLPCKIYTFEMLRNQSGEMEHIPANMIRQLLCKKDEIKDRKQKEYRMYIQEKQRIEEEQKQEQMHAIRKSILEYCLKDHVVSKGEDLYRVLMEYVHTFVADKADNIGKLDIRIVNKLNAKQNTYARNGQNILQQLFTDEKIQISLTSTPTSIHSTPSQIPSLVMLPLIDLCAHLVSNLYKPHSFPSLSLSTIHTKSQIFYVPKQPQTSIANLLTHTLNLQQSHITHMIHLQPASNPFISESYLLYIQSKHVTKQKPQQSIVKMIKTYASLEHSHLQELSTVICLDSQLMFVIDRYLHVCEQIITTFNDIYKSWKYQQSIVSNTIALAKKNTRIVEGVQKMHRCVVMGKIKYMFYQVKNCKIKIRHLPNLLQGYIYRENKKSMNYALSSLKRFNILQSKHKYKHSYAKLQYAIKRIINIAHRLPSVKLFFNQMQQNKYSEKKLKIFNQILLSNMMRNLRISFNSIYMKKYITKVNNFIGLQRIFCKVKLNTFECLKRYAKIVESQQIVEAQTQCSIISKSNNIHQIGKIIRQKFPSFQTYLYLKNGSYLGLTLPNVAMIQQMKDKTGYQHYQFSCQSKSIIRNTLWLVPESQTITLIQKHYLQVLSRAIELGFSKFLYKNEQFIIILNHFAIKKSKKLQQKALKNLREFTMNKVKIEQYSWRDRFYQASIEVQNYKLMERQQKIEQQQRMIQLAEALQTKKNYEEALSQFRMKIVRLEVSSRHLQEMEAKIKLQTERQQALSMFNFWRLETAYHKKYTVRRQLARKKQKYLLMNINRLVEKKLQYNLKSSFTMILVKSADTKAKYMSEQKPALQKKDQNRLLTFQDELNEFISASETQREKQYQQQKQISIIPISFKHFEGSKKENYDVTLTEDEAKKMNGGAYKLNAKTLKFLKRMGKLNQ